MSFITDFFNFNRVAERAKDFEELIQKKDITAIKEQMTSRQDKIIDAMKDYDTFSHPINFRPDKQLTDAQKNRTTDAKTWKLPVPYPVYINEVSVVFLFGQPVKWTQDSEGTDEAFSAFSDVLKRTRFNAKIRQCKRLAGSETESAMLFRAFKDRDGKPDVQIKVLARSLGDEIYTRWDEFGNIISIAWGHYVRENKKSVYHFDIYMPDMIYHCKQERNWEVDEEDNPIGKIPIILFQQDKEWAGIEPLMHRIEYIASHTADTNDYFADPIAVLNADVIKQMPSKSEDGKTLIVKGHDSSSTAASYLTWDSAPESKKMEMEWLEEHIHTFSFTPKISLESLKGIAQLSGKALRTSMLLADIKAAKHKESYDELLDRTANVVKAIVGNVMNVGLKTQSEELKVTHSYSEPFGEDIAAAIGNIVQAHDAGILSQQSSVSLNPLVSDPAKEMERISDEADAYAEAQRQASMMDIFEPTK